MTKFRQERLVFFILALEVCCLGHCVVRASRIATGIAGPFKIIIQNLVECPLEKQGSRKMMIEPRLTRDRTNPEKFFYNGNIAFQLPVSDEFSISIDVASWSSVAGWKANAHRFRMPHFCTAMRTLVPKQFEDFLTAVYGSHHAANCPYPPVTTNVSNFYLETGVKHIKEFIYGKFMGDVQVATKDGVQGCIRAYADTVPKSA